MQTARGNLAGAENVLTEALRLSRQSDFDDDSLRIAVLEDWRPRSRIVDASARLPICWRRPWS